MLERKNYPKIQVRLVIGLCSLLLISSIVSISHYNDVSRSANLSEGIIDHPYRVSNSVRDINIYANQTQISMKRLMLASGEAEINEAVSDISAFNTIINEKFDIVFERFLGDSADVIDAFNAYTDWKVIRDKTIDLVQNNEYEQANDIFIGEEERLLAILLLETQDMIAFADSKAKQFNENSIEIMIHAQRKALLFFIASLCISMILFIWIYRSISKPLDRLIQRIRSISNDLLINKFPSNEKNKLIILNYAISELEGREKLFEKIVTKKTKELRGTRNLLESAIDNASIGMVMMDPSGALLNVNQAFCDFIGYTREEVLTMNFNDFTAKEDRQRGLEFINRIINEQAHEESFEKSYIHKSGKLIHGSVSSSLVEANSDNAAILFAQIKDITKQKQYEVELTEHKEDLESIVKKRTEDLMDKSSKLSKSQLALTYLLEDVNDTREQLEISNEKLEYAIHELESFSYSVSHDLLAPLRAIDGYSKIILEDYGEKFDKEEERLFLGIIRSVGNMRQLIGDILALSRAGRKELSLSEIDLNKLVKKHIDDLKEEYRDQKIRWEIGNLKNTYGDHGLIGQLFVNLVRNAIKFSSKKSESIIAIGSEIQDHQDVIFVRDNGVGFDMKYVDKVFEVFQRLHTSKEFEGTGIGLAIVKQIVNKHNGSIWAESTVDKGTTVYFTLNLKKL